MTTFCKGPLGCACTVQTHFCRAMPPQCPLPLGSYKNTNQKPSSALSGLSPSEIRSDLITNTLCPLPNLSPLTLLIMEIWTYEKPVRYLIPPHVCTHMTLSIGSGRKMGIKNVAGFYKKHVMKLCGNLGSYLKKTV